MRVTTYIAKHVDNVYIDCACMLNLKLFSLMKTLANEDNDDRDHDKRHISVRISSC